MRNMRKSPRQGIVCLRKIERFSNSTLLLELPEGSGLSGTVRSRELGQKRWTYIFSCASLLKRPIFTYSSSQKKWFRFEPIINADPFSLITANKQRWCLTTLTTCSQSLRGFVGNQEKVSQAYKMSVSKKRVYIKRTTLHFFVRNGERFPLLLETNNALRIFMVLSETKSALMITISQRDCLLNV